MPLEQLSDVAYLEPEERKTEQLNVRITKTMRNELRLLAEVWTAIARAKHNDPEISYTPGDVAVRLLDIGLDGAWAEVGVKSRPATEADKAAVVAQYKPKK